MVNHSDVTIESGRLIGETLADSDIRRFLGIPYAEAPVGDLRWKPPVPVRAWSGARDALEFGPSSWQAPPPAESLYSGGETEFSEDCLNLNVWTGPESSTNRPVMVWLHYGAYQFGSASNPMYDGASLAAAGVTVVSVNSRLGRLGFLAHPELSAESPVGASGNYGLMDQIEALTWVQRNIAAFGGDPGNVTLFGVSAGGNSVHNLRSSPFAKGLFHRAIAHSGPGVSKMISGFGHPAYAQDLASGEQAGAELADMLGASSIDDLRAMPVEQLMTPQLPRTEGDWAFDLIPGAAISLHVFDAAYPVIDGYVLRTSALDAYADGSVHDVPLLVGNVGNEASGLPYVPTLAAYREWVSAEFGDRCDELLRLYPASTDDEAKQSSRELLGDQVFVSSSWTAARLHAANCESTVRHFRFLRVPPIPNDSDIVERSCAGAFHAADVYFVFNTLDARDWPWTGQDRELAARMQRSWVSFATSGDATDGGRFEWPQFDTNQPVSRVWDLDDRIDDVSNRERMAFWDAWNGIEVS